MIINKNNNKEVIFYRVQKNNSEKKDVYSPTLKGDLASLNRDSACKS